MAHTAHITGTTLAAVLLVWGAGGAVGAFGSGALTDRYGPGRTLLLAITTLTVTLAALTVTTSVVVVFVVMAVNGATAWAVATPNNHRLTALAPALPGVVISLIYLGQALGAAAGGLLLDHQLTLISVLSSEHAKWGHTPDLWCPSPTEVSAIKHVGVPFPRFRDRSEASNDRTSGFFVSAGQRLPVDSRKSVPKSLSG